VPGGQHTFTIPLTAELGEMKLVVESETVVGEKVLGYLTAVSAVEVDEFASVDRRLPVDDLSAALESEMSKLCDEQFKLVVVVFIR